MLWLRLIYFELENKRKPEGAPSCREGTQREICQGQNKRGDINYRNKWHTHEPHGQTHTSLPSRGTLSAAGSPMQTLPVGPRNNGYCRSLHHSHVLWPHLHISADNKSSTFKWNRRWQINKVTAPKTLQKKATGLKMAKYVRLGLKNKQGE